MVASVPPKRWRLALPDAARTADLPRRPANRAVCVEARARRTVRFPRFFVTSPAPCPYLPGKTERKVFTELRARTPTSSTTRSGGSASAAARPSPTARAASIARPASRCASSPGVRPERQPRNDAASTTTSWSPNAARGRPTSSSICCTATSARATPAAAWRRWTRSITPTWWNTRRFQLISSNIGSPRDGGPGRLVGACLTDRQGDGLSMIYSFYDPEHEARTGLGNYIILDHIRRAAGAAGLPYVYLGYWVEGSSGCSTRSVPPARAARPRTAGGASIRSSASCRWPDRAWR